MDNHTVTGCVYLSLAKKKKKKTNPKIQEKHVLYICFTFIIFFLGEKIEGRGGRSMWLPYMSVTIVVPYLLPNETLYSLYVRNSPIILNSLEWRWGIRNTNTLLIMSYQYNE